MQTVGDFNQLLAWAMRSSQEIKATRWRACRLPGGISDVYLGRYVFGKTPGRRDRENRRDTIFYAMIHAGSFFLYFLHLRSAKGDKRLVSGDW